MDRVAWQRWYDGLKDKSSLFADKQDYFYPTYNRDKLWFEYITFWIQQNWKHPRSQPGSAPDPLNAVHGMRPTSHPESTCRRAQPATVSNLVRIT